MFHSIKKIPKILNKELKIKLLINLFLSFFIPFLELISIGAIAALVLFVLDLESYLNLIPNFIRENFLDNLDKTQILTILSACMLSAIILKNLFLFCYHYFENTLKRKIAAYHSKKMYDLFIHQNYLDHTLNDSSVIQNDILNQSQKCSDLIYLLMILIKDFMIATILISSLFFINFKASIILVISSMLISIIFFIFSGKKTKSIGAIAKKKESELIQIVRNTFEGFKIIILYGKKKFFKENFQNTILERYKYEIWQQTIQKIPRLLFEIIFAIIIISILLTFLNKDNKIENILPFMVFLSLISMRLMPIAVNLNIVFTSIKYIEKPVDDLLAKLANTKEIFYANNEKGGNHQIHTFTNITNLEVKNLSFNYPTGNLKILKEISFQLKNNRIYAIAGKTGSGKSTLLDLLTGVIEPSNGKIIVNNLDINQNIQSWQKNVGYVPQDNFLLNDSIIKNVCFGDDNIDINRFKISIEQAELSDFINNLPQKENTLVGDRGLKISGGQKQRLGLARALYKEKKFLAFDEATSAVDTKTEYNILNTLHKIKNNKIIVIIAHRETTIKSCDKVLHLSEGKLLIE